MSTQDLAIGVDIGGTKIAAGLIDGNGRVITRAQRPTVGGDPTAVLHSVAELVAQVGQGHENAVVGVGAAGWMDPTGSTVLFSPHLAWRDRSLRSELETVLGRDVLLNNDADAAGWAEHRFGAARGHSHAVCLTLGTGIGGAIITQGALQRGNFGVAAEFGHQIIVPGGQRCACGNRGCWEQYASGNALAREGRSLMAVHSPVAQALRDATQNDPQRVTGELVVSLAAAGDSACLDLVVEVGQWLGHGLANLAAVLDPGIFVIGGGLGSSVPLLVQTAQESYRKALSGRGYRPFAEVLRAELGPDAGLVGAADLARIALAG